MYHIILLQLHAIIILSVIMHVQVCDIGMHISITVICMKESHHIVICGCGLNDSIHTNSFIIILR